MKHSPESNVPQRVTGVDTAKAGTETTCRALVWTDRKRIEVIEIITTTPKPVAEIHQPTPSGRKIECNLKRLVRRFWRPGWVESQLISRDAQMIYIVRDRLGEERQVLHHIRGWEPSSTARFSLLPFFEAYHREKVETAVPYNPDEPLRQKREAP